MSRRSKINHPDEVIALAQQGLCLNEICRATGNTYPVVSGWLIRRGVEFKRDPRGAHNEKRGRYMRLWHIRNHVPVAEMADFANVTEAFVQSWIDKGEDNATSRF